MTFTALAAALPITAASADDERAMMPAMRMAKMGHLVCIGLLLVGCGDDTKNAAKDGAVQDAIADRVPADVPADTADAPGKDVAADGATDATAPADTAVDTRDSAIDRGVVVDQAPGGEAGQSEAGSVDLAGDAQPVLDGEAALDALPSVIGFPCRGDYDCCTAVDGCMARTYLYSRAPGANPPPTFPVSTGGCLACIPSAIQLRCVDGQCFGERVSDYSGALTNAHCGHVGLSDAGDSVLFNVLDASAPVIATKTSWSCGG